ncbi:hypothetical protein RISK_004127 [Rhodopirellula islandica]|uniref:Uncharacterized protein n=1 Tax=Rhodopirellula islandica TaxID=595434 RepID=A0A0J1BAG8_RHOIS|nr:hypothetical protein RISK_004127 [Rhodopirellula islandica]
MHGRVEIEPDTWFFTFPVGRDVRVSECEQFCSKIAAFQVASKKPAEDWIRGIPIRRVGKPERLMDWAGRLQSRLPRRPTGQPWS